MHRNDLILFFDVNGTIIASDQAQHKSAEAKILQQLAKKYRHQDNSDFHPKLTLRQYALAQVKASPTDYAHYQANGRLQAYRFLLDYLAMIDHPFTDEVKSEFQLLQKALNSQHGMVFHSFYRLIHWLRAENITFSIVLRSFGHDIPAVMAELAEHQIHIGDHGHFKGHVLELNGTTLEKAQDIMNSLTPGTHAAWRDDYTYWHHHHQQRYFGKLFFVDKPWPRTMFFDDNAIEKEIIVPINATDEFLETHQELIETGRIVAVNPLEALIDNDYFVNLVKTFLQKP